jgi:hypothetical protein
MIRNSPVDTRAETPGKLDAAGGIELLTYVINWFATTFAIVAALRGSQVRTLIVKRRVAACAFAVITARS